MKWPWRRAPSSSPQSEPPAPSVTASEALDEIRSGQARPGLRVAGSLELTKPDDLGKIPSELHCFDLKISGELASALDAFPEGISVERRLDLFGCERLKALPVGLSAGVLILQGATSLRALPERMEVSFLDITACVALEEWPETARVQRGNVDAAGCQRLQHLPSTLGPLSHLDIRDCVRLSQLPPTLAVWSWIDLAGSAITELPDALAKTPLRWRGVPVEARVAFQPETITAEEALSEPNAELRRVLIERMGFERFMEQAGAEVLDEDDAPGGRRRLLRVGLDGDEPVVCVSVGCPSTGRRYLLRVPPQTRSCHAAVAWTAGYDDPQRYRPELET